MSEVPHIRRGFEGSVHTAEFESTCPSCGGDIAVGAPIYPSEEWEAFVCDDCHDEEVGP